MASFRDQILGTGGGPRTAPTAPANTGRFRDNILSGVSNVTVSRRITSASIPAGGIPIDNRTGILADLRNRGAGGTVRDLATTLPTEIVGGFVRGGQAIARKVPGGGIAGPLDDELDAAIRVAQRLIEKTGSETRLNKNGGLEITTLRLGKGGPSVDVRPNPEREEKQRRMFEASGMEPERAAKWARSIVVLESAFDALDVVTFGTGGLVTKPVKKGVTAGLRKIFGAAKKGVDDVAEKALKETVGEGAEAVARNAAEEGGEAVAKSGQQALPGTSVADELATDIPTRAPRRAAQLATDTTQSLSDRTAKIRVFLRTQEDGISAAGRKVLKFTKRAADRSTNLTGDAKKIAQETSEQIARDLRTGKLTTETRENIERVLESLGEPGLERAQEEAGGIVGRLLGKLSRPSTTDPVAVTDTQRKALTALSSDLNINQIGDEQLTDSIVRGIKSGDVSQEQLASAFDQIALENPKAEGLRQLADIMRAGDFNNDQVAQAFRQEMTSSAATMRAVQDARTRELIFGQAAQGIEGANKAFELFRKLESTRRAFLVSQLATTMRNFWSQGIRYSGHFFEDSIRGLREEGLKGFTGTFDSHFAATMHALPGKESDMVKVLLSDVKINDALLGRSAYDGLTGKRTLGDYVNFFNKSQENFWRKVVFENELSQRLADKGLDIATAKVDDVLQEDLEQSIRSALEVTFALDPQGKQAREVVRIFSHPILTALGPNPYPRFAYNQLRTLADWGPFGWTRMLGKTHKSKVSAKALIDRVLNGEGRELLEQAGDQLARSGRARLDTVANMSSKELGALSKQLGREIEQPLVRTGIGTLGWGIAAGIVFDNADVEGEKITHGEKWYEIRIGDKTFDVRPYSPLSTPMLFAQLVKNRMYEQGLIDEPAPIGAEDVLEGTIGVSRLQGTGLGAVTQALQGRSFMEGVKDFVNSYLGAFSTPAKTLQAFQFGFTPERDTSSSVLGRFIGNIPGAERVLPVAPDIFSEEPRRRDTPRIGLPKGTLKQAFGISPREKSQLEIEGDKYGVTISFFPATGNDTINRLIKAEMGKGMQLAERLIQSKRYQNASDFEKGQLLKKLMNKVEATAKVYAVRNNTDVIAREIADEVRATDRTERNTNLTSWKSKLGAGAITPQLRAKVFELLKEDFKKSTFDKLFPAKGAQDKTLKEIGI